MTTLLHQPVCPSNMSSFNTLSATSIPRHPHSMLTCLFMCLYLTCKCWGGAPHLRVGRQDEGDHRDDELSRHFPRRNAHAGSLQEGILCLKLNYGMEDGMSCSSSSSSYWRRLGSSREVAFIVVQHVWSHAPTVPSAHHAPGSDLALICQIIEEKKKPL